MSAESRKALEMELDRLQYDRDQLDKRIAELQAYRATLVTLISAKQSQLTAESS
jgi:predicted  nucleic acid-binding Zn-ribbon protein